jgi:hypothetical protein
MGTTQVKIHYCKEPEGTSSWFALKGALESTNLHELPTKTIAFGLHDPPKYTS